MKNRPKFWEMKQSAEPGILEMYIYGYVEPDGYDWYTDEVIESETSAEHFRAELAKYPDVKQINLYVNSHGGYVFEAMAIRNQLKRHPAKVVGIVDGFAVSSASFILTACDVVKMYSNTMQMAHDMRIGVFGNAQELRKTADDCDTIMVGNRQAYLEKAGGKLTEEKLQELMVNETWLTAKQCLEYGLCDEVINATVDLTKAQQMLEQANHTLEQQVSYRKALTAQYQELLQGLKPKPEPDPEPEPGDPPEPEQEPEPEPVPDEPVQNKTQKLMAALFR